eukprot:TRINITY_DN2727_c0_g1_i1.p1 TRINITY_DN2727_c0_g1~~TRINITY_DN2727_c0_g1_i1.p1  ORF type:complete len:656 (-),score=147.42 TRINITY_DN2727_c0_g1_i1:346-2313(-)
MKKAKAARVVPADAVKAYQEVSVDSLFAFHLREITTILSSQQEQSKMLIDEARMKTEHVRLENNELRTQIANLQLQVHPKKKAPHTYQNLLDKQHIHANKVLLKRDHELREATAENAALRETLAAMQTVQPPEDMSAMLEDLTGDATSELRSIPFVSHGQGSRASEEAAQRLLRAAAQYDGKRPYTPASTDLVTDMRIPDVPFHEGAITNNDDSSDDDEPIVMPPQGVRKTLKSTAKVMDLKQRMRDMMTKNHVEVYDLYRDSGCAQYIAKHWLFENITMLVITLNAVWIGIDTELNQAELLASADIGFVIVENLFCVYFTAELILRFLAFEIKWLALRDKWFLFDAALAVLMITETWVLFAVLKTDPSADLEFGRGSTLRLLKLLRLSRVARMVKLMRLMPEVMVLIRGIGVASRSVMFTLSLLWMITYVFAVAFTQLCKDTNVGNRYFPNLGSAALTLFFKICFGEGLMEVSLALYNEVFFAFLLFIIFTILGPLTVMNMLLGVLVEVVRVVASFEQDSMDTQYVTDQLTTAFSELDEDGDGRVSLEEFTALLDLERAVTALSDVGIDTVGLLDDPDLIFQGETSLTFDDFVSELMGLREGNPATFKDIQLLRKHLVEDLIVMLDKQRAVDRTQEKDKKKRRKKRPFVMQDSF